MKRTAFVLVAFLLVLPVFTLRAKDKQQYSDISITVLKAETGKPVRNAAVVLHGIDEDGKQQSGGMNLKTDLEGKTAYSGVPYGKLRIQVIAHGLQTFGQDYDINQPQQEFVIKMDPPQKQHTIYGDNPPNSTPKDNPQKPDQKQ